jgi:glycosyltransferase involved in cell wall biosynthesis
MKTPIIRKVKTWLKGDGWPVNRQLFSPYFENNNIDLRVLERWRPITDRDVPDADVVIATWWQTAEWVAALAARKGAKVYFIQGHEVYDHLPVARVRATYRAAMYKIVVSQWLRRLISEKYGSTEISVVPNSIDHEQFFAPVRGKQSQPSVGFLYAPYSPKGIGTALAVIKSIRERLPNLRTVSFGSSVPDATYPLPQGTEFSHLPPQDRIRDIYSSCDVWLTASRSEGFNLTALEAMACRTPVVSTRTGWPADAIRTGWNGSLADIDDVTGLTRGVEWVLSRTDVEWQTLSANAHATATASSWQDSAKLFENALQCAMRKSDENAGRN